MGINVKLEVHMNSMWHSGNAAAEASANPVPLTVFRWLHAAFPHTRATRPQTPLQDFPSRTIFFCAEELEQECCALPWQCLFSQAGAVAYPDRNGHGRGAGYLGQGVCLDSGIRVEHWWGGGRCWKSQSQDKIKYDRSLLLSTTMSRVKHRESGERHNH